MNAKAQGQWWWLISLLIVLAVLVILGIAQGDIGGSMGGLLNRIAP